MHLDTFVVDWRELSADSITVPALFWHSAGRANDEVAVGSPKFRVLALRVSFAGDPVVAWQRCTHSSGQCAWCPDV